MFSVIAARLLADESPGQRPADQLLILDPCGHLCIQEPALRPGLFLFLPVVPTPSSASAQGSFVPLSHVPAHTCCRSTRHQYPWPPVPAQTSPGRHLRFPPNPPMILLISPGFAIPGPAPYTPSVYPDERM